MRCVVDKNDNEEFKEDRKFVVSFVAETIDDLYLLDKSDMLLENNFVNRMMQQLMYGELLIYNNKIVPFNCMTDKLLKEIRNG